MNIWVWVLLTKVVMITLTVTSVAVNSQYTLLVSVREERLQLHHKLHQDTLSLFVCLRRSENTPQHCTLVL